jgi:hypothetical protein
MLHLPLQVDEKLFKTEKTRILFTTSAQADVPAMARAGRLAGVGLVMSQGTEMGAHRRIDNGVACHDSRVIEHGMHTEGNFKGCLAEICVETRNIVGSIIDF